MLESTMSRRAAVLLALLLVPARPASAQTTLPGSDDNLVDRVVAMVGDSSVLHLQVLERVSQLQVSDPEIPREGDPDYDAFYRDVLNGLVDQSLVLHAAAKDTLIQV